MFIEFDLGDICRPMLQGFLPRGSGEKKGVLLSLSLRANVFLDYDQLTDALKAKCDAAEEDDGVYQSITESFSVVEVNLLFVRPMNYTIVLAQVATDEATKNLKLTREGLYAEVGNHDSCWDSYFSELNHMMRGQGQMLVDQMKANLKPEFQDKLRSTFNCRIAEMSPKAIHIEEIGEREWSVAFEK